MAPTSRDHSAAEHTFHTTLLTGGKNATGIEVPADIVAALGRGKRPPVNVTVNGHTYRSTIGVMGGRSMIPVSAEHRKHAGIAAGDDISVTVSLDTEPRTVTIPDDLGAALDTPPATRAFFDSLPPSLQRWHVESVTTATTPETRQRRIARAVDAFRAGRQR